jgi:pyrimidine operon attenuation protein / uracil phosphoribosyltransferase
MGNKSLILNNDDVQKKISRISYQIIEDYYNEKEVIIVGISNRGFLFANVIFKKLQSINTEINFKLVELKLDKNNPNKNSISTSPVLDLQDKTVILVDDVLNSGKTLIHAASYLVSEGVTKLNTSVLIDRRHRSFPIKANWVGLTLSTTFQEHISVEFEDETIEVFLQ